MVKHILRKTLLNKLKKHKAQERRKKSLAIKRKLFSLKEFKNARYVMFYVSKEEEVDTSQMIKGALKLGKKVVVPVVLTREKRLV